MFKQHIKIIVRGKKKYIYILYVCGCVYMSIFKRKLESSVAHSIPDYYQTAAKLYTASIQFDNMDISTTIKNNPEDFSCQSDLLARVEYSQDGCF